jgi:hypothetical protein
MGLTAKPNLPNFDQMTEPNADQMLQRFITPFSVTRTVSCPQLSFIAMSSRINMISNPGVSSAKPVTTQVTNQSGSANQSCPFPVCTRILTRFFFDLRPFSVM